MMVVTAPAKQAIFLSNYDAKFCKSIRVILSGVTQLSVRDPEIGGASAAHTPYFRHPFVNCVSPIFIDGKNRKGPGKLPVLARFAWSLIRRDGYCLTFHGFVCFFVAIVLQVHYGWDKEGPDSHQETDNAAEPEPGADPDRIGHRACYH